MTDFITYWGRQFYFLVTSNSLYKMGTSPPSCMVGQWQLTRLKCNYIWLTSHSLWLRAAIYNQQQFVQDENRDGRDPRTQGNISCYNDMYLARANKTCSYTGQLEIRTCKKGINVEFTIVHWCFMCTVNPLKICQYVSYTLISCPVWLGNWGFEVAVCNQQLFQCQNGSLIGNNVSTYCTWLRVNSQM